MEVEGGSATGGEVGDGGGPVGFGDDSHELAGQQAAVATRADSVESDPEFGKEGQDVGHHEPPTIAMSGLKHGVGVGEAERDRLFDENMLTCVESADRPGGVLIVGNAKIDESDVRVGQEGVEVGIAPAIAEVDLSSAGTEVALDGGPVAGELAWVSTTEGDDPSAIGGDPVGGQVVDHAHEADANETDADHGPSARSLS